MRYFRHTTQHNLIAHSTDESIGHAFVPDEGSLNGVRGKVICSAVLQNSVNIVSMYGCDGWMVPVDDPDTPDLVDDLWDRFVEKDFDIVAGSFDIGTGTDDTSTFNEPGVVNADRIGDLETLKQDQRWYRRRKMVSFAERPRGFLDGTPDTYIPTDVFNVSSRDRFNADRQMVAILGFGSPTFNEMTATHKTSPTETEWIQIKYMEVILEQAWMDLAGLTEAGAETPYEEAVALIADMLEPTVIEDTAGAFHNHSWDVFTQLTWDLSVPGRRDFSKALTGAS